MSALQQLRGDIVVRPNKSWVMLRLSIVILYVQMHLILILP